MPMTAWIANHESSLHGSNSKDNGQEIHNHLEDNDHKDDMDDDSPTGADIEQEGDEVSTIGQL